MSSTPTTITEAQVVEFLTARANDIRAAFGADKYAVARAEVCYFCDTPEARLEISSGALEKIHRAPTFAEAMALAGAESPAVRAANKRAAAAALLAEADALAPVAQ